MTNMLNSLFNALASHIDSISARFAELTNRQTWHDALMSVADATRFSWHALRDVTISRVTRKFRAVLTGDTFGSLILRESVALVKLTASAVRYTYTLARAHAPKLLRLALTLLRKVVDWIDPEVITSATRLAYRTKELALKCLAWLRFAVRYVRDLYALPKLTC